MSEFQPILSANQSGLKISKTSVPPSLVAESTNPRREQVTKSAPEEWQLILHHSTAVVLWSPSSNVISIQSVPESKALSPLIIKSPLNTCKSCGQHIVPVHIKTSQGNSHPSTPVSQSKDERAFQEPYMDANYFSLIASSQLESSSDGPPLPVINRPWLSGMHLNSALSKQSHSTLSGGGNEARPSNESSPNAKATADDVDGPQSRWSEDTDSTRSQSPDEFAVSKLDQREALYLTSRKRSRIREITSSDNQSEASPAFTFRPMLSTESLLVPDDNHFHSPIPSLEVNKPHLTRVPPDPPLIHTMSVPAVAETDQHLDPSFFNQGYYDTFFAPICLLGHGSYGKVFKVHHILNSIILGTFAVKILPVGADLKRLIRVIREVKGVGSIRSPNVVEYKHCWLEYFQMTIFGPRIPCLFILMELADGGNLEDFIQVQRPSFLDSLSPRERDLRQKLNRKRSFPKAPTSPETVGTTFASDSEYPLSHTNVQFSKLQQMADMEAYLHGGIGTMSGRKVRFLTSSEIESLFYDITSGLAQLHAKNIVHRDLKPQNLLLQFDSVDSLRKASVPRVLISDFGECQTLDDMIQERTGTTGTLEFSPPEFLDPHRPAIFSTSTDMYALGLVLYYLCYSRILWKENGGDIDALRREILEGKVHFPSPHPPRVHRSYRDLIVKLLSKDPSRRPSAQFISATHFSESRKFPILVPLHVPLTSEQSVLDESKDSYSASLILTEELGPNQKNVSVQSEYFDHKASPILKVGDIMGGSVKDSGHFGVLKTQALALSATKIPEVKRTKDESRQVGDNFSFFHRPSIIKGSIVSAFIACQWWTLFAPCHPFSPCLYLTLFLAVASIIQWSWREKLTWITYFSFTALWCTLTWFNPNCSTLT